ncbi:MAG: transposase [Rhodobacteraceae bacterium]|nr:transposase [Paracoccaceae bacterium]
MTFIAALRVGRIDAPFVLDGPAGGDAFRVYVERFLVPTLAPKDVVVMDNLSCHKGMAIRRAIRQAGAHLLFLPPYSPDLNTCCATPPSGPPKQPGGASATCWTGFHRRNAQTTSGTRDMLPLKVTTL